MERIVLFDKVVDVGCPPCIPDGRGSSPKSVGYVKLGERPDAGGQALVYEGAQRVEVTLGAPVVLSRYAPVTHPAPPKLTLQYRSAADADWRLGIDVPYGEPILLDVTPQMTDMPHSTHSLWVFRLTSERPEKSFGVPMTVTVIRGRDVVDWPGHPDFYAERTERVVMQQHVTTHMGGYENIMLYGSEGTWANPEKLISWGTQEIHIFANVTSIKNAANVQPTSYFLEAHNATIIGPEITFGSRHRDIDGSDDLASYHFALKVDDAGMDGPYQPESRWGFRLMAMFGDVDGVIGACPGCFAYDVEYDVTVVALRRSTGVAQEMEKI